MTTRQYKIVREVHDQDRFFSHYPEYAGYRLYLAETPYSSTYNKTLQYLLTREAFSRSDTVNIDEGTELLPVSTTNSSIHLGNNKVVVYRPERHLSEDFEIVSYATDGESVEKFGGREIDRKIYNLYNAKREGLNGYKDVLVRVFTDSSYTKGMKIPANETIGLHVRHPFENPHYLHDTNSKAYKDRVWKALRSFF